MRVNESNLKIRSIYRIAGYENTKMEIAELMGTVLSLFTSGDALM